MPLYCLGDFAYCKIIEYTNWGEPVLLCGRLVCAGHSWTFAKSVEYIRKEGSKHGYLPQENRSIILVSESNKGDTQHVFSGTEITAKTGAIWCFGGNGDG